MSQQENQDKVKIFQPAVLILNIAGILLNHFLSMTVRETGLPFYIDTVGTITVTALSGLIPGIITALVTNIINVFLDGEAIYYASLNMLIAIAAAFYFGKEKKKHLVADTIGFIAVLALIGGGIGSLITWFLYAAPSDAPLSVAIMGWLSETFGFSVFGSHVVTSFITDFIDKTISVLLSFMLIYTLPPKVKNLVKLSYWYQAPLSLSALRKYRKSLKGSASMGIRTTTTIVLSTLFTAVIISWISLSDYRSTGTEWLSTTANQFAALAAKEINPEMVNDYLRYGTETPGYSEVKDRLVAIKNSSPDIVFLYIYKPEEDGCHVVFDLDGTLPDGTYVVGDPPGTVVDYEIGYAHYREDMLAGLSIPSMRVKDDYGEFIMTYYPIYDSQNNCVCYSVVNVSVARLYSYSAPFLIRVLILFSGFFILTVILAVWITRYRIVMPIVSMTQYANEFVFMNTGQNDERLKKLESLNIRTKDEVELLYRAMCKMNRDMASQMHDISVKSESIAKLQNGLIITMADMVESRDSDTGAHIQKTAAYVRIILQGLKKNGYYAEKLTDKYMSDVEMSAPLHDVGKIKIPDAILNKPGKLSPEEFEIMKTHTTEGKNFLENAISTVEGDNYLKEARNMAAYHHERWDGLGYPEGLHGQVIPLSARIMAVADVFDALVSPRIYKPAFPLDEAIKILEDGAGKQFDPKVVEVFIEALPEVRTIMNRYKEA